jgi:hypothetical protein
MKTENPLGDVRARRLQEIVKDLTARTTRPAEMADAVFNAMIRRMATHQLVDEELRHGVR